MVTEERRGSAAETGLLDRLVDGIWQESTHLETILVVHAYTSLRHALARTLQHYGYRALEASSREQALRLLREERPEAILLDRALRENDGIALALEIAHRADLSDIPVLAIASDRVTDEDLRAHGFREALVMPIEQKDLLAAVDRALDPARRRAGAMRRQAEEEQCRLALEDRLKPEHLTLFSRFPTSTRIELRPGSEATIRSLSARLAAFGIQPEIEMESGALLLRYEVSIAEALSLDSESPVADLATALGAAFPELASRPEALLYRIRSLESEYRRLLRMAS